MRSNMAQQVLSSGKLAIAVAASLQWHVGAWAENDL